MISEKKITLLCNLFLPKYLVPSVFESKHWFNFGQIGKRLISTDLGLDTYVYE